MRMNNLTRLIPALALALGMAAGAFADNARAPQGVRVLGRSMPNAAGGFVIQWPGSGFETTLDGTLLTATIDDYGDNWLNVEVDGAVRKLDLLPGVNTYTLFSGAPGAHTIRVTRRTGSPVGPTRFLDIRAKGTLAPTEAPERRILVIGDSITSGYGVECLDRSVGYTHDTENADLAYPALLAKSFGADLQSVSVNGRGLVRNYAGDDPSMDTVAWRMLPDSAVVWPVSSWQPQVIVVNLGTSDFAAGDPGDGFDAAYVALIRRLRSSWPDAHIFAAFGSMLDAENYAAARASILGAAEAARLDNDPHVAFIELKPTPAPLRYGCDWHPGLDAHKAMAAQLRAPIQKALRWTAREEAVLSEQDLVWSGATGSTVSASK